ncbi:hypothetical protein KY337_02895 [Candidatus Woesearchaeota archaeon]|nr:hypothetical protein [Candidatus Woesearchaeota archaeon]
MSDLWNNIILWKPLKWVSGAIYAIVVLLAPLSSFWSVIFLFGLISLWSRVPCLVSKFTKDLDVIDFFVVMLGIHVGGTFGGIFGATTMMFSRIFGPREWFLYTVKDSISIMICGFMTPVFYAIFGNALHCLYAFTILRWALYLLLTAFIEPHYMGLEIGLCTIGSVKSYIYNTFVMKTFEPHLLKVFEGGLHFSWTLFLFATAVVGGFYFISRAGKLFEVWLATRKDSKDEDDLPKWCQRPAPW